jgi:predicted PolB exonuclease-like 3'-5' exonuclease
MNTETLREEIIDFFENIEKYYSSKTEIIQGLFSEMDNHDAHLTAWNLSEFELVRSAYRNSGDKFMLEGIGTYFEISAERIIDFKETGRNKFEFIEKYGETVFRITKIRFHYKY